MQSGQVSQAVCFNCRLVEQGAALESLGRCPRCSYPLILNTAPVALESEELDRLFRVLHTPFAQKWRESLPGITPPVKRRQRRRTSEVSAPAPIVALRTPAPAPAAASEPVARRVRVRRRWLLG
jgi:hypothetical protein